MDFIGSKCHDTQAKIDALIQPYHQNYLELKPTRTKWLTGCLKICFELINMIICISVWFCQTALQSTYQAAPDSSDKLRAVVGKRALSLPLPEEHKNTLFTWATSSFLCSTTPMQGAPEMNKELSV